MKTLDQIATALSDMTQAQREALGQSAGVPFDTVQKIALRQTKNPRTETYLKLARALEVQPQ